MGTYGGKTSGSLWIIQGNIVRTLKKFTVVFIKYQKAVYQGNVTFNTTSATAKNRDTNPLKKKVNIKMFSTASLMILLLFNLMIFRNTVKCHQIESVNEKLNTTEENCQDGICKEIIDYKSSLDSSDISSNDSPIFRNIEENETFDLSIPENTPCEELPVECINCQFDLNCLYGHSLNVTCKAKSTVKCKVSSLIY